MSQNFKQNLLKVYLPAFDLKNQEGEKAKNDKETGNSRLSISQSRRSRAKAKIGNFYKDGSDSGSVGRPFRSGERQREEAVVDEDQFEYEDDVQSKSLRGAFSEKYEDESGTDSIIGRNQIDGSELSENLPIGKSTGALLQKPAKQTKKRKKTIDRSAERLKVERSRTSYTYYDGLMMN